MMHGDQALLVAAVDDRYRVEDVAEHARQAQDLETPAARRVTRLAQGIDQRVLERTAVAAPVIPVVEREQGWPVPAEEPA